jgi:DNA repair exonuclease SbcCD ATPase subunit
MDGSLEHPESEKMAKVDPLTNAPSNGHVQEPLALPDNGVSEAPVTDTEELELLRSENADLRTRVAELDQLLATAAQEAEERLNQRQGDYEALLEEKSEVIRALHQKITDVRENVSLSGRPLSATAKQPDAAEVVDIKRELEEQRRQMVEDEEAMMSQLRQMEMALARDRAELARQRSELQRLHDELKHEMEAAARDGGLRERLSGLQRRNAAVTPAPRSSISQGTPPPATLPKAAPPPPENANGAKSSGIFRRLFGKGQ